MNVFLDTSVIDQDLFLDSISLEILLKACEINLVNIFISEVVLMEHQNHFSENTSKVALELDAQKKHLKNLFNIKYLKEDLISKNFEIYKNKIEKLIEDKKLTVIDSNDVDFQILLKKACFHEIPFEQNEKGFKDAVIIESYKNYMIKNKMTDVHVIAADGIFEKAFESDSNINLHKSLKSFITSDNVKDTDFYKWNNDYCNLHPILKEVNRDEILKFIDFKIDDIYEYLCVSYHDFQCNDLGAIDNYEDVELLDACSIKPLNFGSDECSFTMKLKVRLTGSLMAIDWFRERNESDYQPLTNLTTEVLVDCDVQFFVEDEKLNGEIDLGDIKILSYEEGEY